MVGEVRVRVLGGFGIEGVEPRLLGSRKARTLLQALALARGRPVSVDALAEWLWPKGPPVRPPDQVRVLVSRLRGVLGSDRLIRSDAGYALVQDWLDVDALSELVDEAHRRAAAGSPGLARAAAGAALALARGPLLPEEPDAEWAEADRALAVRLEGAARRIGAEAALATGDLPGAVTLAEGALDHDPYDEAVLRTLMTALARSGRPASALAAYAAVRSRLSEDLGVGPAPETEELHTSLLLAPHPATPAGGQGADVGSLPGRADALATLDAALGRAAAGRGGLVIVEGEAGIGKSQLLAVWSSRAEATGATVLRGRCEELARGLPLQVVLDALDDHRLRIGADAAVQLLGSEAGVLVPLLGQPSAGGLTSPPPSALRDQASAQLQVFAALVNVVARLPAPSVLVVDDVHLAGSATIEWLHYAARRAADLALLIVCAQRPEEASGLTGASTVRLGPLDEVAAAEVVGADRAAELVVRSGGNPLFLVELAAADPADRLPATVREAVDARCDRAGPAVAVTLRAAALIGSSVDLDLLASVLRASPVDLLDHLEEGVRRGLLIEQPTGFAFRHDLVRDALEASAGTSRRALVHREAGRILAARSRTDPSAVAYHARLGGDEELAAGALVEAAAVASARFDQLEALRLLDEALDMVDSLAGRLLRARVLIMMGDYERASGEVDAAVGMGGGAAALELGAWAAHYRRDFATAVHLADEGARVAEDVDQRVGCLTVGGWVSQCRGDLRGAERRLEEADREARGIWRPVTEVWLGGLRVHQGRCDEAVVLIRPATINQAVGVHGHPALHAYLFAALAFANVGRCEDALAAAATIDGEASRTGATRWEGRADNVRGWILRGLGEWRAADEANARGLERSAAVGMREPMAHAHLDLAAGALVAQDLDRAVAEVGAAMGLGDRHAMAWRHGLRARLYQAEIALAGGDSERATTVAADLLAEARERGVLRYQSLAGLLLVRARLAAGENVDLAAVDRVLAGLGNVAGMEAWRLTATVAAAAGVERWWALAETRAAELAAHAGPRSSNFERVAAATLERMRTAKRRR